MNCSLSHIAIIVPDLQAAEGYYQSIFGMELIGREAELADGLWYTLPFDKGWDDVEAAGIELGMLALRKGQFVLALFRGDETPGQVFVIGLQMSVEEIARVRAGLPKEVKVNEGSPDRLEFRDPYQITWQISAPGNEFRTSGDWANRWLGLETRGRNHTVRQYPSGGTMSISNVPLNAIGWVSIATGITGLLGFVFIMLFFTVGQPFGTLNDICIGLTALLSVVLVWMFYPGHHAQFPLLSKVALVIAIFGGVLVMVGAALAISGARGWFLSGLYMAAGNAMIGLWLLALSYSALRGGLWPHSLVIFGLVTGVILALGLVTIPGIFRGIDTQEYELTLLNYIWWTSSLGYLALYPAWCILLGRTLILK